MLDKTVTGEISHLAEHGWVTFRGLCMIVGAPYQTMRYRDKNDPIPSVMVGRERRVVEEDVMDVVNKYTPALYAKAIKDLLATAHRVVERSENE